MISKSVHTPLLDRLPIACVVLLVVAASPVRAQTGTFIDRWESTDLRVVSYNIHLDDMFPDENPTLAARFARVMQALKPDVVALQEIYDHNANDVVNVMNSVLPLGGGATWYAHQAFDNVLVSKYPMSMMETRAVPSPPSTSYAMALVDLPDDQFATDFYFMNSHFKCCSSDGWEEERRQNQADALVSWMRDARSPGGFVTLPTGTPMAVVGDLNLVQTLNPLNTLLNGDIALEVSFGADSPPDWDGTSLTDAHPVHNGTGTVDWTYRSGSFSPSRLDYVLYTDSVADTANRFLLNTVSMSAGDRSATGLQQSDVMISSSSYDHIPMVVDFRLPAPVAAPGDFNGDGVVDSADYIVLRKGFGTIYSENDFDTWRAYFGSTSGSGTANSRIPAVPEPASNLLLIALCGMLSLVRCRLWQHDDRPASK